MLASRCGIDWSRDLGGRRERFGDGRQQHVRFTRAHLIDTAHALAWECSDGDDRRGTGKAVDEVGHELAFFTTQSAAEHHQVEIAIQELTDKLIGVDACGYHILRLFQYELSRLGEDKVAAGIENDPGNQDTTPSLYVAQ